jgi:hypothetical protein
MLIRVKNPPSRWRRVARVELNINSNSGYGVTAKHRQTTENLHGFLLSQFTAVGTGLSLGTDGFSLGNADVKGFDPILPF